MSEEAKVRIHGKMLDTLESIAWAQRHFDALITSKTVRRRDVLRCVAAGLAKSVGRVMVCDDDGYGVEPERWREGFVLTEAGQAAIRGEPTP